MAKYKAGDLSMYIEGISDSTIKSLDAVIERLDLINGGLGKIKGKTPKTRTAKSSGGNGILGGSLKLGVSIYMVRRLARSLMNVVQVGSDYLETMNLWQVAMRENLDLADEFVNKMQKAYGVSAKTTMQAQATFKNMIGSLGDLADETAYKLSEAITQMAFDYSSLYNVKLSQAVDKFQSALAGQVRPIRSISGFDITEKTIHNLYQSIGGTKTQRQLSRTEKQLLAILAVFQQMEASGATGDLGKTLNMFANQSRMATEHFQELVSWTGMLLVDLIDSWGIMIKINAVLITITEIIKAIAKSRGVGDKNFVDGIWESAEGANEEVDKLQGKLLDFDKFRSMSGEDNALGIAIDQKLLDAIGDYTSKIDFANNEAQKLADTWLEWWLNDEGGLTEKAQLLLETLEFIGTALGILIGIKTVEGILSVGKALSKINSTTAILYAGIAMLVYGWIKFSDVIGDMTVFEKLLSLIAALTAAFVGLYIAKNSFGLPLPAAAAMGAALSGIVLATIASVKESSIKKFADGGVPDKGTLFIAGEAGAEIVTNSPNGQTGVTNVQQIQQAMYNALVAYGKTQGSNGQAIEVYLDGEKVYQNTTAHAKRRGKVWSNA